jgi:hypothetical protein
MGQYYIAIILDESGKIIRTWVRPGRHLLGHNKLMEHSYIGNEFMAVVENLLCPEGMFYKSRLVWAGDYADSEVASDKNLYHMAEDFAGRESVDVQHADLSTYGYIVNHTMKLYVDKNLKFEDDIHPLSLLTAEGNGRGGGDYSGASENLVGTWARDVISLEKTVPDGFVELKCPFHE